MLKKIGGDITPISVFHKKKPPTNNNKKRGLLHPKNEIKKKNLQIGESACAEPQVCTLFEFNQMLFEKIVAMFGGL